MSRFENKTTYPIKEEEEEEMEDRYETVSNEFFEDEKPQDPKDVDKESFNVIVQIGQKLDIAHWLIVKKIIEFSRIIQTVEGRNYYARTIEKLIMFILTAILAIGGVIFISFIGYKIYLCNATTKTLLKRISNIQGEKIKLLKIIENFADQNETFFDLIRNETDYFP